MATEKTIALEKVKASMNLRRPQQEALDCFHNVLNASDYPLDELSLSEVSGLFKRTFPDWDFPFNVPEFTFHLATGVGKTRLIGALIAYLFLSKQSKDFMIVSPRAEIIRKFIKVCSPCTKDYLFVSSDIIDYPNIFTANHSVKDYEQPELFASHSPRIWIFSPQTFTARNARLKQTTENDPCSAVEYFTSLKDLVIFFDESHHLGLDSTEDHAWRTELNALNPKMIIGTTASISGGQNNIIYSYDLKTCLNEHKYTKFVRMIPDKKPDNMLDDVYDHVSLQFALKRLELKQRYLDNFCTINNLNNRVKATMLVACEDINHAEAISNWLQSELNNADAVLLVHSRLNENEFIPQLKKIEDPLSPVKVVVNVGMLNEGWDVSNIFVITPLRAMASTTLVTQVMGRGLRLPFGKQVGEEEIDTLDVLCFGRESLQEIVNTLTNNGFGTGYGSGITVDPKDNVAHPEEEFIAKKKIELEVIRGSDKFSVPQVKMVKEPLPLDLVTIPALEQRKISYFLINDPKTIRHLGGSIEFNREEFINIVATDVLSQCKYLNFSRHYTKSKDLIDRFLINSGIKEENVKLNPIRVAAHIVDCLNTLNKQQKVSYSLKADEDVIQLSSVQVTVPEAYQNPNSNALRDSEWNNRIHKGIPFGGWVRCKFRAIPFDNKYEYHVAHIIDTAEEVNEWFRNLPGMLTLETPAGKYSPDFAIFLNLDNKNVLLEVKDDDRFGREDQDATIKANAARAWCKSQSEAQSKPWEYWLLLSSDALVCENFDDIKERSDIE